MLSTAELELPYPAAALFDLAADIEAYPSFLPGWIEAHVEQRDAQWCRAVQTVGLGPVRLRFRTQARFHRPERIEIDSDDPQFRRLSFSWCFAASAVGSCRVSLTLDLELRSRLLQRSLEWAAPSAAGDVLGAFAAHARQRLQPVSSA